jgi:hypothetical protein
MFALLATGLDETHAHGAGSDWEGAGLKKNEGSKGQTPPLLRA